MSQFLRTISKTCEACPNLITLEPGPEQCDKCLKMEQKETEDQERRERDKEQRKRDKIKERQRQDVEKKRQKRLENADASFERKRAMKRRASGDFDMESLSSHSSASSSNHLAKVTRKSDGGATCVSTQKSIPKVTPISTTSISSKNSFIKAV